MTTGKIYFITDGEFIKIGYTEKDINTRLAQLQTANAKELIVVLDLLGSRELEKQLHKKFGHLKIRGEWFRKEGEILEYIRSNNQDAIFTVLDSTYLKYRQEPKELFMIAFTPNDHEIYVAVDHYPGGIAEVTWKGMGFLLLDDYVYVPLSEVESARRELFDVPRKLRDSTLKKLQGFY
jgi:hypothetical protein